MPNTGPYVEIAALARKCSVRSRFMSEVLRCITRAFAGPYAALHIRYAAEVIQDDWHQGPTDPAFWKPGLQQFLTESLAETRSRAKLLLSKTDGTKIAFLSSPVFDPTGPAIGALALVAVNIREPELAPKLAMLESLCRFASFAAEFIGRSAGSPAQAALNDRALTRAAGCSSAEEFAFAITNELRNKFGFEQIALGLARRNRIRILSVSGLDHVPERSPGTAALRGAMEECLDVGTPVRYPVGDDSEDAVGRGEYFLHKQWCATTKGDSVASVPLQSGGVTVAVLSLRKRTSEPIRSELLRELRGKVESAAPALLLLQRSSRSVLRHGRDSIREILSDFLTPGRWGRKALALSAAIGVLWFAFGTVPYAVTAHATVSAQGLRHLSAPFEGALEEVHVAPADRVKAGDALCRMDDRELAQQKAALSAELEVWERRRDQALAIDSPAEARLAEANQELVRAKLGIVTARMERAVVRAPFDGVIVSGDLRTSLGSALAHGQPLLSIAPLDVWTLELQIPETEVRHLDGSMAGTFASHARPEQPCTLRVSRVRPSAETKDHKNVFTAEAIVQGGADWLRPGMEGVARVDAGRRRVCWVAFHGVLDWLRMRMWL